MRFDITIDRLEAFERVNGYLQKTITDFIVHRSKNSLKQELQDMLEKYRIEFEIDDPVPEIEMTYKGDVIIFTFKDHYTREDVLLFTEWFARRKKSPLRNKLN